MKAENKTLSEGKMKLFEELKEELRHPPAGTRAPYYYIARGYGKSPAVAPPLFRAAGSVSLFTETPVYILPGERIAGNLFSVYADAPAPALSYAEEICRAYGDRDFLTNADHFAPDYAGLLQCGVGGLLEKIAASRRAHAEEPEKCVMLDAMALSLQAFRTMIGNYAARADALIGTPGYSDERLSFIARNCRAVEQGAPATFAQALQLVWLCHNAFGMAGKYAMALGRMDQYLYPFYEKDIAAGVTDDAEVVELLENVFIRLEDDIVNICVGGTRPDGTAAVNPLSGCILEAVKNCRIPGPNLSVRLTENTPDDFLDACLVSIGTGLGYPALMNDAVNLAALSRYGYAKEDVTDYCMVGCIENFLQGKQPPWTDGRFDTPRLFALVLHRGKSKTGEERGVDTGSLAGLATMADFLAAFSRQLDHAAEEYYARFRAQNDGINQAYYPEPFLSCFCDDCIGRGLDINGGGAKYPSVHGAAVMGIGTVADAFAAIERVVYDDRAATLEELRDALDADFAGYEALREKLLAAPKYGNNDDFADKYAAWLVKEAARSFDRFRTRDGGPFYLCMAANVSNIYAGRTIGATPDGRRAGEPLSDAASPTYGRDVRGATATLHSLAKPDYSLVATGSVVNQKYSPAMFGEGKRAKLLALIRTYFAAGGQEIQINATSPEILRDAMAHPEKYPDLVVRVSGFSAYFVTLDRAVQRDILCRTQKE